MVFYMRPWIQTLSPAKHGNVFRINDFWGEPTDDWSPTTLNGLVMQSFGLLFGVVFVLKRHGAHVVSL